MSSHAVMIRSMQMDDLEQVLTIDRQSFSLPWPASSYRFELQGNQASRSWVAECVQAGLPARIVAMIVIWQIVDEAHIATIAVHPAFRHLGIGKHLLAYTLKEALRQGMHLATLEVRAGNRAALAMYRQFGFEVVGIRPRYYQDNQEDAWIMSVKLRDTLDWIRFAEKTLILPEEVEHES